MLGEDSGWKRLALIGAVVFVLWSSCSIPRSRNSPIASISRSTLKSAGVKDMGSAAVGLALLLAAAAWLLALAERLGLI